MLEMSTGLYVCLICIKKKTGIFHRNWLLTNVLFGSAMKNCWVFTFLAVSAAQTTFTQKLMRSPKRNHHLPSTKWWRVTEPPYVTVSEPWLALAQEIRKYVRAAVEAAIYIGLWRGVGDECIFQSASFAQIPKVRLTVLPAVQNQTMVSWAAEGLFFIFHFSFIILHQILNYWKVVT